MSRDRIVNDPEFGPIALPRARISKGEWESQERAVVAKLRARRTWKRGQLYACPVCGKRSFEGRDDITYEANYPGKLVVFGHLHGARCKACSAETIEAYELIDIEDKIGVGMRSDYEAKVARIGSGTLGTYWPKDIERVLRLRPNKRAFIEVVGPDAVIVRFREPGEPRGRARSSAARGKRPRLPPL